MVCINLMKRPKGPDQTEILIAPSQYPTVAGSLKYKDLNNDGKITRGKYTLDDHGDLTVIGNDQIRYRFGATFAANWSGFDISAFFQGVMKHNYYPTASDKIFGVNIQLLGLINWRGIILIVGKKIIRI